MKGDYFRYSLPLDKHFKKLKKGNIQLTFVF